MKRRVYTSRAQRRADQVNGFWTFLLVNIGVYIVIAYINQEVRTQRITLQAAGLIVNLLPWVINVIVFVLAASMRPEFAKGYIGFVVVAFFLAIGLGAIAIGADFVAAVIFVVPPLGVAAWIAAALFGLYHFGRICIRFYDQWAHDDPPASNGSTDSGEPS